MVLRQNIQRAENAQCILVLLDGSLSSEQALLTATLLARANRGSLYLLSLLRLPSFKTPGKATSLFHEFEALQLQLQQYIDQLIRTFQIEDLVVSAEVLLGKPVEILLTSVHRQQATLLVVPIGTTKWSTQWETSRFVASLKGNFLRSRIMEFCRLCQRDQQSC